MFNVTDRPVRRTAIALSTLSLLAAAGCAATASDSGMAMQDRPMSGMSMPQSGASSGMMGQGHAMPQGMNMPRTAFS